MSSFSLLNRRWLSRNLGQTALFGTVFFGSIAVLCLLIIVSEVRLGLTVVVGFTLVILATVSIRLSILATLAYLIIMGDLRRLLIPVAGWAGTDPLLLIGPTFAIVIAGYAMASGCLKFDTTLSPWILGLMGVMAVQMLNPRQGGLMVGIAGALFYIIPLLWYWIGQTFATEQFVETLLYRLVVPLATGAIVMGLYQVFYGYLPHQQLWFECCAYTALDPKGIQAPISFFASSIEYSIFSLLAGMALWARFLYTRDPRYLLAVIPFVIASFLMGSRGPIGQFIIMAAALWAALSRDKRTWVFRGAFALTLGGVFLVISLLQISEQAASVGNERIAFRMQRQADGFLNIADPKKSTATVHKRMMIFGIIQGAKNPLGNGLGSTTQAANKFGRPEGIPGSMEVDISNLFLSTGVIGGGLYLVIIFLTIRQSISYWASSRKLVGLCIAGILGLTFLNWLEGGRYALTPIVWFIIGALDRLNADDQRDLETDVP